MLDGVKSITLSFLNRATQAWVELEYNRKYHSEIGCTPLERLLAGPEVSRPAPDSDSLRLGLHLSAARTSYHISQNWASQKKMRLQERPFRGSC